MRIVGLILTSLLLTSTVYAKPKVEEKIIRTPGHTTIIYKDYSKKKEKAEPRAVKAQAPEVEFREYNVGTAPQPVQQPTQYTSRPAPVEVGPNYTQTYTPGPNKGMAANRGGTFSSGFLQTNGFAYGYGYGYGPGFAGPGFVGNGFRGRFAGPGFQRGFPSFGPGLVTVGVPSSFYGMPQQRFAPPPFIGAGYPVNGGFRANFRGGGCRR